MFGFFVYAMMYPSVQCSMCCIKYKCSDSGAFVGSGAVRNVHCAVCSVLPAKYEDLAVETGLVKLQFYLTFRNQNPRGIFTNSTLWAGSVIELPCPYVCVSVGQSIRFYVFLYK